MTILCEGMTHCNVLCDSCEELGPTARSATAARDAARKQGYHVGTTWYGIPADLCAECDLEIERAGTRMAEVGDDEQGMHTARYGNG